MFEVAIAVLVFIVLLVISVPVSFSLFIATLAGLALVGTYPLQIVAQQSFAPASNFLFLAIPFFILTADLLASGKLGQTVIGLATKLVGRFRGGVGQASVATSVVFSGVSGSAVADASGLGSVLIPWSKKVGYPGPFNAAVNASSSVIGVILPPSIPMILFAATSGVSVAAIFLSGLVPGIILAVAYFVVCWAVAAKKGFPRIKVQFNLRNLMRDLLLALPAVLMPIIMIRVVLLGGIATVTEVAVLSALYAVLIRLIYRDITFRGLLNSLVNTAAATGVVMLLIMMSEALSWFLTVQRAPQEIAESLLANVGSPLLILLLINLILLLIGAFLDMSPAILLLTPVLMPIADAIGLDPIQLGMIMILNLGIGLFTPPVGTTLYISTAIAKEPIEKTVMALLPFYAASVAVLLAVTYIPALTSFGR
ncbi:TRAP transporter large permease [Pseudarthrobacter sp. NS4]|uniref:TRAP transporter large permease n=1 Tax=Pseudarthrobacter sp. NS4 TaxID=2973976 RepID=UPI0021633AA2|nr:TRAP transporter large permease subunit [Pseudarthrobacter sp. NS4]